MSNTSKVKIRSTGPLRWFGQLVAWLVIIGVVAVIAAAVVVPRIAGATPYSILTGSMQPKYPPGTLVVVKPIDTEDIAIGKVVTYQLKSGKPTVVTHRVVGMIQSPDGTLRFRTQGDANDAPDRELVRPVQVKGALWYDVPYLGYVNKYITGKERRLTMVVVVSGLLLYAAYMFTGSLRDRLRKPRKHSSADAS
ncbi:signal peptidase [Aeromicrobium panaciterrae]|uniref:Signal peptidase I n=1 Tax=Aeromicrobium panaciterrae TaxID=363861 RepID=A0ABU1UNG2_9ACTN|nr:signal peptidase I [Aeromicrobium panaciterrae]MDR7086716.1 signal peptidase [Aeromicrobium panaciterrae]